MEAADEYLSWHFFIGGQLSKVVPVRVVQRRDDGVLLWLANGSPIWQVEVTDGRHLRAVAPDERPTSGYPLRAATWGLGSALLFQPAGACYAVWWLFGDAGDFAGWYVNLEHRIYRGRDILVEDNELDLSVAPDRTWRWKDEDSFVAKTGVAGYWTADEAHAIRREGQRVADQVGQGRWPFSGELCDFTAPAIWSLPERPALPPTPHLPTAISRPVSLGDRQLTRRCAR